MYSKRILEAGYQTFIFKNTYPDSLIEESQTHKILMFLLIFFWNDLKIFPTHLSKPRDEGERWAIEKDTRKLYIETSKQENKF